ncbi:MAG: hypothetical protein HWD92_05220 [Flavobacteriia bacterium]|nr:hypothetical protein [Flavobacteriia bacterium]
MGLSLAGSIIKGNLGGVEELASKLNLKFTPKSETVYSDKYFVDYHLDEDDVVVIHKDGCYLLFHHLDWLGTDSDEMKSVCKAAEEGCMFFISETAGDYHVFWYRGGASVGHDHYMDSADPKDYHVSGPAILQVDESMDVIESLVAYGERQAGGIPEDYRVQIYACEEITATSPSTSKENKQKAVSSEPIYQKRGLSATIQSDSKDEWLRVRCKAFIDASHTDVVGELISLYQESVAHYKKGGRPSLGHFKGGVLESNHQPSPIQRYHMFHLVKGLLLTKGSLVVGYNVADFSKVMAYHVASSLDIKLLIEEVQSVTEKTLRDEHIQLVGQLESLAGTSMADLKNKFNDIYPNIVELFVKGGLKENQAYKEDSIAELKVYLYLNVINRTKSEISSAELRDAVLPRVTELLRRGAKMNDLLAGDFNPDARENKVKGRKGESVKIGGIIIIAIVFFRIIIKIMRAAGE